MNGLTDRARNPVRRSRTQIAVLTLATTLAGCGASVGGFEPTFEPWLMFGRWDSLSADSCWGTMGGAVLGRPPTNVRLQFWYATAQGETVRVLRGEQALVVPAQITRGEPRYPRVGAITWDGGAAREHPRAPVIWLAGPSPHWSAFGADSMSANIFNDGGYAYHLTMTIENRNGVEEIPAVPDPLPWFQGATFRSVPLNSAVTPVAPRILKIRWEDYGGKRDSLVPP